MISHTLERSKPHENHPRTRLSHAPDQSAPLWPTEAREAKSLQRTRVRIIGHRVRPIDPDNFATGVSYLLQGLRHAGLVPIEAWRVILETEQVKVRRAAAQKTVIEIYDEENRRCRKCGLPLNESEAKAWRNTSAAFCEDCTMTT